MSTTPVAETTVILPSGAGFTVYTPEVAYFDQNKHRYERDFAFENGADIATLDQLVINELFVYRYGEWLSTGRNYHGEAILETGIQKMLESSSREARQLRSSLNVDRASRDAQKEQATVADYLDQLRKRAGMFGVVRNMQFAKTIEIFQELRARMTLLDNTTEGERAQLPDTDIIGWLRNEAIPEFEAIDEEFRNNGGADAQKIWIHSQ